MYLIQNHIVGVDIDVEGKAIATQSLSLAQEMAYREICLVRHIVDFPNEDVHDTYAEVFKCDEDGFYVELEAEDGTIFIWSVEPLKVI